MATSPTPPRFWWLKRLVPAVALVAFAWAGFHWWLTRHVAGELAARVEAWRAAGGWPLPEQIVAAPGLVPPTVAGEVNSADLVGQAIAALPAMTVPQEAWYMRDDHLPIPPEWSVTVKSIVSQDAPALALLRRAADAPAGEWNFPAGGYTTVLPDLWNFRHLGTHLSWAMALDHEQGRIAEAMRRARDMLRLSRTVVGYCPCIVTSNVAAAIDRSATDALRDVAHNRPPTLTGEAEAAAWRDARPQVASVVDQLLDSGHDLELARRAFQGQAVMAADMIKSRPPMATLGLRSFGSLPEPVLRPFVDMALLDVVNASVQAADGEDGASRSSKSLPDFDVRMTSFSAASVVKGGLYGQNAPDLRRTARAFLCNAVRRRASAVVLASKLFNADTGRWPGSFDDLVPSYLPRVPDDPFAAPGTPLRLRTDLAIPFVYGVGENGTDEGGSTLRVAVVAGDWPLPSPFDRQDAVYPLYLPPEAARFAHGDSFDVLDWLRDPEAALREAERADAQSRADAAAASGEG